MMNNLQKIELDMLKVFLSICKIEGLKYFLVCGSALGAVKYKGFIPWDDDIDVALPREDYEKFLSVADKYLPDYYFIQNYRTDPEFPKLGTKLRDSRTTYIEKMCDDLNINHGVFIDIFPLDCHWKSHSNKLAFKWRQKIFEGKRRIKLNYNRLSRENLCQFQTNWYYVLYRMFGAYKRTSKAVETFDRFISKEVVTCEYWCNYANSTSTKEYSLKTQYGDGVEAEFEGLKVVIPCEYDDYLTQKYGNWRMDLPDEQQKGHHYYETCDLEKPFTYYTKR